jgi:hypothetical protein
MFSMTGTTGSNFNGVLATEAGKLGYRNIGGTSYRVRVEPTGDVNLPYPFTSKGAHYSAVVEGEVALAEAISSAAVALAGAPAVAEAAPTEKVLDLPNGSEIRVYTRTEKVVEIDGEELSEEQVSEISNFLAAFAQ